MITPAGFANRVQLTRAYLARKEAEIESLRQAQLEAESGKQKPMTHGSRTEKQLDRRIFDNIVSY